MDIRHLLDSHMLKLLLGILLAQLTATVSKDATRGCRPGDYRPRLSSSSRALAG